MEGPWLNELSEILAGAGVGDGLPARATAVTATRHLMLCLIYGGMHLAAQTPEPPRAGSAGAGPAGGSAALFGPGSLLGEALFLGSVGGASDLDAMDPLPAHTALPAGVAAVVLGRRLGAGPEQMLAAVAAGLEAGAMLSERVAGRTPGVGYHSAGSLGTLAAAAAAARLLGLAPAQVRLALGLGATRAAGLAPNSRHDIGMTHFGWATAHGIEAALLAEAGWRGHPDVEAAVTGLLGGGSAGTGGGEPAAPGASRAARRGIFYKLYPCNVYLNLVAVALGSLNLLPGAVRAVAVELPPARHLDNPGARGLRERRNSLQAVVHSALTDHDPGRFLAAGPGAEPAVEVTVRFNPEIPTDLRRTRIPLTVSLRSGEIINVQQDASVLEAPDEAWAGMLTAGSAGARRAMHQVWATSWEQAWPSVIEFLTKEVAACALLGQS